MTEPATGTSSLTASGAALPQQRSEVSLVDAFQSYLDQSKEAGNSAATDLRETGKNRVQDPREADARKRSPWLDPTSAAVAELASPGAPKPIVAEAQAIQSGQIEARKASAAESPQSSAKSSAHPRPETRPEAKSETSSPKGAPSEPAADPARPAQQVSSAGQPKAAAPRGNAGTKNVESAKTGRAGPNQAGNPDAAKPRLPAPVSARAAGAAAPSVRFSVVPRIGGAQAKSVEAKAQSKPVQTPRSAAREEALTAQFGRGLAAALRQNGGSVTLRLQPEALGDLKIKMSLEPGKVEASFEVQTSQARDLLGKSMDKLRSALEAQGLEVSRLDVQVAEPACSPQPDSGQYFGGADADSGRSGGHGSEHPGSGMNQAARTPPSVDLAEPTSLERPRTGHVAGGALRVRFDALA